MRKLISEKEFENFFKTYARNVDRFDEAHFWKLSDAIIKNILIKEIEKKPNLNILDAGGGTARWPIMLSEKIKAKYLIYDLSEDMLKKADYNIRKAKKKEDIKTMQGSLEDMSKIKDNTFDYIFSIYNVISFISNLNKAFSEMYRVLKDKGKIIIMGQGKFNTIAEKINSGHTKENEIDLVVNEDKIKWGKDVPALRVFSKEALEGYLKRAGFKVSGSYGIPIFTNPGPEDFTFPYKKISKISKFLENKNFFNKVLETEIQFNHQDTLVNRGMNIISVGLKE